MDFFDLLTMIGGLALFLYGMHLLSEGLEKLSGGRLERVLENLTNNRLKAVLLGAGVTTVIQSSSATTVMVVGFVNSGIMKLSQAIGIIMGANVGTTITSWILSLTGIESSNFFLRLVKPTSFSPVLAVIGVVFIMFMKNGRKRDLGAILVGFAILMTGMDTMSSAMKPLSEVPWFTGNVYHVYQPGSRIDCRSACHGSHSVFIGICWYFAGALHGRWSQLRSGSPHYPWTKYWYLCHRDDVRCRGEQKCEACIDCPSSL